MSFFGRALGLAMTSALESGWTVDGPEPRGRRAAVTGDLAMEAEFWRQSRMIGRSISGRLRRLWVLMTWRSGSPGVSRRIRGRVGCEWPKKRDLINQIGRTGVEGEGGLLRGVGEMERRERAGGGKQEARSGWVRRARGKARQDKRQGGNGFEH